MSPRRRPRRANDVVTPAEPAPAPVEAPAPAVAEHADDSVVTRHLERPPECGRSPARGAPDVRSHRDAVTTRTRPSRRHRPRARVAEWQGHPAAARASPLAEWSADPAAARFGASHVTYERPRRRSPRWRSSRWIHPTSVRRPRWPSRWPGRSRRSRWWRSSRWSWWRSRWRWRPPERAASPAPSYRPSSPSSRPGRAAAAVHHVHELRRAGPHRHGHHRARCVGPGVRSQAEPHLGRRRPVPPQQRRDGHGHHDARRRADGALRPRSRAPRSCSSSRVSRRRSNCRSCSTTPTTTRARSPARR